MQVLGGDKLRPRGKEKTHLALVGAAQNLLATGTTTASIQEITELAGVGFGSFYNHFESKEQLFAEAVSSTLDAFDEFRDRA